MAPQHPIPARMNLKPKYSQGEIHFALSDPHSVGGNAAPTILEIKSIFKRAFKSIEIDLGGLLKPCY